MDDIAALDRYGKGVRELRVQIRRRRQDRRCRPRESEGIGFVERRQVPTGAGDDLGRVKQDRPPRRLRSSPLRPELGAPQFRRRLHRALRRRHRPVARARVNRASRAESDPTWSDRRSHRSNTPRRGRPSRSNAAGVRVEADLALFNEEVLFDCEEQQKGGDRVSTTTRSLCNSTCASAWCTTDEIDGGWTVRQRRGSRSCTLRTAWIYGVRVDRAHWAPCSTWRGCEGALLLPGTRPTPWSRNRGNSSSWGNGTG